MEAIFNYSNTFSKNKDSNNKQLLDLCICKSKMIFEGLCMANYLSKNINNILETHLNYNNQLTPELIKCITSSLELIKVD